MLSTLIAIMLIKANATQFSTTTLGEYYEVSQMDYDTSSNITYGMFTRYYVSVGGNTTSQHFQIRPYAGKVSLADLMNDAQVRSDKGIKVVTPLK